VADFTPLRYAPLTVANMRSAIPRWSWSLRAPLPWWTAMARSSLWTPCTSLPSKTCGPKPTAIQNVSGTVTRKRKPASAIIPARSLALLILVGTASLSVSAFLSWPRARKATVEETDPYKVTFLRMEQLAEACRHYNSFVGLWPTNLLAALSVVPIKDTNCARDAWGHPFAIRLNTNGSAAGGIWLISYGADGKPGGTGENADCVMTLP